MGLTETQRDRLSDMLDTLARWDFTDYYDTPDDDITVHAERTRAYILISLASLRGMRVDMATDQGLREAINRKTIDPVAYRLSF